MMHPFRQKPGSMGALNSCALSTFLGRRSTTSRTPIRTASDDSAATGVNAGLILGQRGGVKPGQWIRLDDMERAGALSMSSRGFGSGGGDLAGVGIDGLGGGRLLLRPGRCPAASDRLLEGVTVAVHGQDADVMGEPVEQGAPDAPPSRSTRPCSIARGHRGSSPYGFRDPRRAQGGG